MERKTVVIFMLMSLISLLWIMASYYGYDRILMLKALYHATKERKSFPLPDMEEFTSFASREIIKSKTGNIQIDRVKYLNDVLIDLLQFDKISTLKLNSLIDLPQNFAEKFGKIKGKLFLNSIPQIDKKIAQLLTRNLKYLSLRGLKNIEKDVAEVFSTSNTFVSLKNNNEQTIEESVSYSRDVIEQSIASNKKEFSSFIRLLFLLSS